MPPLQPPRHRQTTLAAFFPATSRCFSSSPPAVGDASPAVHSPAVKEGSTPLPSSAPLTSSPDTRKSGSLDSDDDVPLAAFLMDGCDAPVKGELRLAATAKDSGAPRPYDVTAVSSAPLPLFPVPPATRSDKKHAASARRGPGQRLTQTTLDLGQRGSTEIGQRCPLCNMVFNLNAEDAAVHRRYCRTQKRARHEGRESTGRMEERPQSPSASSVRGGGASELSTSRRAVEQLESILGRPFDSFAPAHTPLSLDKKNRKKKEPHSAINAAATAATSAPSFPITHVEKAESFTCVQLPALSTSASPHTLQVVMLVVHPPRSPRASPARAVAAADTLLTLLGLAHHLCLPFATASPHSSNSSDSTLVFAFVVDATLRLLLSAAVGQAKQREQDPDLCVHVGGDGRTLCSTRRNFTRGDIVDVWQLQSAALWTAQTAWEQRTTAPYTSAAHTLKSFFKVPHTSLSPLPVNDAADASAAAGTDALVRRLSRLSRGVAVYSVARWLHYGVHLSPFTELSYAPSVLASESTCSSPNDVKATSDVADVEARGDMYACLCAAAPLYPDTERGTLSSEEGGVAAALFCHGDDDGGEEDDASDGEWRRTDRCDTTVERRGKEEEEEGRARSRTPPPLVRRRRSSEAGGDDHRLSVVSYSSDAETHARSGDVSGLE